MPLGLAVEGAFDKNVLIAELAARLGHRPTYTQPDGVLRNAPIKILAVQVERIALELKTAETNDSNELAVIFRGIRDELHQRDVGGLRGVNWRKWFLRRTSRHDNSTDEGKDVRSHRFVRHRQNGRRSGEEL